MRFNSKRRILTEVKKTDTEIAISVAVSVLWS